jgi:hypothetical protein
MTLELAAGMIKDGGTAYGGEETVAAVSLETGKASFWMGYEPVTLLIAETDINEEPS